MQRGREFIGLPVRHVATRERLGHVTDLLFDTSGRLSALVIMPAKGIIRKERVVAVKAFSSMTSEGVFLHDLQHLGGCPPPAPGLHLLAKNDGLCGRRIVGQDGREIGTVGDIVVSEDPKTVWGFEVSDGILMDLLDGRPVIEARGAHLYGDDILLTGEDYMNFESSGHPTFEGSDDD